MSSKSVNSSVKKIIFNKSVKALKILSKNSTPVQNILKEISIHKSLSHKFIVQYVCHYEESSNYNLILEYSEFNLRSLIVPEIGISCNVAHMLFCQLLSAVKYLHSKGICHRDIKPDNILITKEGNIKLCDFGYSTVFQHKEYRRLKTIAGTYSFMAPEVFLGDYDGPSADVFSMGVTLLNMLTGRMPWESASRKDEKYKIFRSMKYHYYEPFNKLREDALAFLEGTLAEESQRMSLTQIEKDRWFCRPNDLLDGELNCRDASFLREVSRVETELHYTQPEVFKAKGGFMNISQPIQLPNMPSVHRFYIDGCTADSLQMIERVLATMGVLFEAKENFVCFSTTDTKRNVLTGELILQGMQGSTGVTVRRTRGDTSEFKKFVGALGNFFE